MVKKTIDDLLRDHLVVLSSSKTSEDGMLMCLCVYERGEGDILVATYLDIQSSESTTSRSPSSSWQSSQEMLTQM